MNKMKLFKALVFTFCLSTHLFAQPDVASSNLAYLLNSVQRNPIKTGGDNTVDKKTLKIGAKICVLDNGKYVNAMVTQTGAASYGFTYTEGIKKGKKGTLKPEEIKYTDQCPEEYVPIPDYSVPDNINLRTLEDEITKEINILRANPTGYAQEMKKLKFESFGPSDNTQSFMLVGNNDFLWFCDDTDNSCKKVYSDKINVAINYLTTYKQSMKQLVKNNGLVKGSETLAADQGKINGPKHTDSRGVGAFKRCQDAGYQNGWRGEVLAASNFTAAGFVVSFLSSPGHRDILLKKDINEIGVSLFKHGTGKEAYIRCVINVGENSADDTPANSNNNSARTVTDSEGNVYKTATINGKTWMAENLRATKLGGQNINANKIGESATNGIAAIYWYDNDRNSVNSKAYGALYTWAVVTTNQNVCPSGWHVATLDEWNSLINSYPKSNSAKGEKDGKHAAYHLREKGNSYWEKNESATNSSGLSARPGGWISNAGSMNWIGERGAWWAPDSNKTKPAFAKIALADDGAWTGDASVIDILNIRCVKD